MAATASAATDTVPGLIQAPESGKFFVKPSSEDGRFDLTLRVTGEPDYTVVIDAVDDSTLTGNAWNLTLVRKLELRKALVALGEEVELLPA